jgi:hypothetical protein
MAKQPAPIKTNLHAIFATDKNLEEDGAWVEVNGIYGLEIKVRRMKSDASIKAGERLMTELLGEGRIRKPDDIKPDQMREVMRNQIAEAVLIDWKNLRNIETGDKIEYSQEMAFDLLGYGDFFDFVYQAATERDAFKERSDEDAEGN